MATVVDRVERAASDGGEVKVDVLIVGAGFAGLYALYKFRGMGFETIALEAGSGVGGTWYWNRYPGARVDIESMEYSYSFSEELQQEWEWSERYAGQPELMAYANHVADRFDLRRSILFDARVASAHFDDQAHLWRIGTTDGRRFVARYCVMATGFLNAVNQPDFPGQDSFEGAQYHTGYWPEEGVDFTGQRVGIIGTGSSAVQSIPIIASQAGHLTVFQRTPPFSVPLRNCPLPKDYERMIKSDYPEWRRKQRQESNLGALSCNFGPIEMIRTSALEATPEERRALYEDRYASGGLAIYNIYPDVFTNLEANDTVADFMREKIRERIDDPAVAELLVPTGYPALTKRLCADTGYYEAFNRDNVTLVDIRGGEIEFTPKGLKVKGEEYALDAIISATGFDALTGQLTRIDIRGGGGLGIADHWRDGARTALGLMIAGFPNMFLLDGPGSPCPLYHPILLAEEQTDWIAEWITHMEDKGLTLIEPSREVEQAWVDHLTNVIDHSLFPLAKSWYMGANIPGKKSIGLADFGGIANYRQQCSNVLVSGFAGFRLESVEDRAAA